MFSSTFIGSSYTRHLLAKTPLESRHEHLSHDQPLMSARYVMGVSPGLNMAALPKLTGLGNRNRNAVNRKTLLVPLQQLLRHLHLRSQVLTMVAFLCSKRALQYHSMSRDPQSQFNSKP